MRELYGALDRETFWNRYWKRVGQDVDQIEDVSVYPLFPVDQYVKPDSRILEAGCGLGRVVKHYHRQGVPITGLEYDPFCVETLKKEYPELDVVHGSITELPFEDGAFDIAMAFGVIGHLKDAYDRALSECARVLKDGGILAGSLCVDNLGRRVFGLVQSVRRVLGAEKHFYTTLFRRNELSEVLARHGFVLEQMHPVHSKSLLFSIPLFRRPGAARHFSRTEARNAEKGYELNRVGQAMFRLECKLLRWQLAYTCSFIARLEKK